RIPSSEILDHHEEHYDTSPQDGVCIRWSGAGLALRDSTMTRTRVSLPQRPRQVLPAFLKRAEDLTHERRGGRLRDP
ncbi:MAG: hypothetical protein ABWY78_21560, partial [Microvirga sp.]